MSYDEDEVYGGKSPKIDVGRTSIAGAESRVRLAEVPGAYSMLSTQPTYLPWKIAGIFWCSTTTESNRSPDNSRSLGS